MKFIIKLFFLLLLFSCQNTPKNNKKQIEPYKEVILPYTSQKLKPFYSVDSLTGGVELTIKDIKPITFTKEELLQNVKNSEGINKGNAYYPLIYFYIDSIIYKGIIYNGYSDNDINAFVFQLTSYDNKGKIIDAILLDSRFIFEVYYWNDFTIRSDGYIDLIKYSHQLYDFSEENYNVKKNIESKKNIYKMNKGKFEKVE
ncbi:hypothetical protein ETU09_07985 [Apibacter muscae]|uniref:Uncharacterized protein n=1 Tax=Apibacter muscae TaxID=2509004 RepID=A0A563DC73_9FLAO|nr:hypothetical protein [Apibacter muscae]TWP27374.1 hypothetical protein ETU09_07985 [Apibacter muscae]